MNRLTAGGDAVSIKRKKRSKKPKCICGNDGLVLCFSGLLLFDDISQATTYLCSDCFGKKIGSSPCGMDLVSSTVVVKGGETGG